MSQCISSPNLFWSRSLWVSAGFEIVCWRVARYLVSFTTRRAHIPWARCQSKDWDVEEIKLKISVQYQSTSIHKNYRGFLLFGSKMIKVISQCRSTVSPRIWHVLCVPTLPASNVCIAEGSQLLPFLPFLPWRLESPPGHDGIVSLGTFKKTVSCAALYHLRWEKARTEEYAAEVCDFPWFQDLLSELEEIGPRIYSVLEQDVENCGDVDSDGFRSGSFVAQSFAASKRWVKATAFLHLTLKRPPSLPN